MAHIHNLNGKPALYLFLLGVLSFNLSSMPGFNAAAKVHSADLYSFSVGCDIDGQMKIPGQKTATCKDEKANGLKGTIKVEDITPADTEAQVDGVLSPSEERVYKITSKVPCETCLGGTQTVSKTVNNPEDLQAVAETFFEKHTKEVSTKKTEAEQRAEREERCEEKNGKTLTKPKDIWICRLERLKKLNDEKAEDYYAEFMKDDIQTLLESSNAKDRAFGMGILSKLGKERKINCPSRPGVTEENAGDNPLLNQAVLNPSMSSFDATNIGDGDNDDIVKSSCQLWAFGTYNNNVQYLQTLAQVPGVNRDDIRNALTTLQTGWGTYFAQQGLVAQENPRMTFSSADSLLTDLQQSNTHMKERMSAIVAQHEDLLKASEPAVQAQQDLGRAARAGKLVDQPFPGGVKMQVNPNPGPFRGAPAMGTPVGQ